MEKTKILYSDLINYDDDLPKYNTVHGVEPNTIAGQSESNPNMWIDAIEMLFSMLQQSSFPVFDIKSISVSGQQHGLVCLDKTGKLSRSKSKLWNDFSTQEECDLLTESIGGDAQMIAEVGNAQRTGYTASKIYHIARHEPEAFQRTTTLFLVHTFINWILTGAHKNGLHLKDLQEILRIP